MCTDVINQCGGGPVLSGMDLMLQYGTSEPGDYIAIQHVVVHGTHRATVVNCGDTPGSLSRVILEYFRVPANDAIAEFMCGESIRSGEEIRAHVAVLREEDLSAEIRAALPAIPPGQNTAFLNRVLTPAQFNELAEHVDDDAQITWSLRYDYDGCHGRRPQTHCQLHHCLVLTWEDSESSGRRDYGGP